MLQTLTSPLAPNSLFFFFQISGLRIFPKDYIMTSEKSLKVWMYFLDNLFLESKKQ